MMTPQPNPIIRGTTLQRQWRKQVGSFLSRFDQNTRFQVQWIVNSDYRKILAVYSRSASGN